MDFGGNVLDSNGQTNESPAAISKAVACLPAGQMFELMIQMKGCIQNNAMEARTMLAKNPQLTYALLHAQILLNIVDPKDLLTTMASASAPATPIPIQPATIKSEPGLVQQSITPSIPQPVPAPAIIPGLGGGLASRPTAIPQPVPAPSMVPQLGIVPPPQIVPRPNIISQPQPTVVQPPVTQQPMIPKQVPVFPKQPVMVSKQQPMIVTKQSGVGMVPSASMQQQMREQPGGMATPQTNLYSDTDFRTADPRMLRNNPVPGGDQDMRSMLSRPAPTESAPSAPTDPRSRPPEVARNDPRLARGIMPSRPPPSNLAPQRPAPVQNPPTSDQDKTALIMQVLQLSDEQIALLPPDQRSSILLLKEQIARSTQR